MIGALLASGCGSAGYRAQGLRGGYSEKWQSERAVTVHYDGNGYTTPAQAAEFALYRACELALTHGFTHFRIAGGQTTLNQQRFVTAETYLTGQTAQTSKPSVDLTVVMLGAEQARAIEDAGGSVVAARFYVEQNAPRKVRSRILGE